MAKLPPAAAQQSPHVSICWCPGHPSTLMPRFHNAACSWLGFRVGVLVNLSSDEWQQGKLSKQRDFSRLGLNLVLLDWFLWPFLPQGLENVLRNKTDSRWVSCIALLQSVVLRSQCIKSCSYLDVTKTRLLPLPFPSQRHIWSSKTTQAELSSTISGFCCTEQQRGIW